MLVKKIKHRLISNLSKWPEKLLKGKKIIDISDLNLSQGKSFGAIKIISETAKKLGIQQSLGYSKQAKLAMIQIAGRIIAQGSRYYLAKEWQEGQAIDDVFTINKFSTPALSQTTFSDKLGIFSL